MDILALLRQPVAARSLAVRAMGAGLLLFLEKFLLNFLVDFNSAQAAIGLGAQLRVVQHWGFRFAVTFLMAIALFSYVRPSPQVTAANGAVRGLPLKWSLCGAHLACVGALAPLSWYLYGDRGSPLPFAATTTLWLAFALLAVVTLLLSLAPWRLWRAVALALRSLWFYAAAAALLGASAMRVSQDLWQPTVRVTFRVVTWVLAPLLPDLDANSSTFILSSHGFSVLVSDVCSGLEGVGLMLAFCGVWLVLFRREYRFPRALLLIPVGVLLILILNVLRIAALMLIGSAGWPDVAAYGFHSQAGWIGFNLAAAGLVWTSRRSAWFTYAPSVAVSTTENPTAPFVLPLVCVLGAGMLARALSGQFDTLYGLRLPAALVCLFYYRRFLRCLNWHMSWRGAAVGVAAALLWLLPAHWMLAQQSEPMPLANMAMAPRLTWIALRALIAIAIVPVVEELAYRGFLMRRLLAEEFESLPFHAVRPWALLLSAVVFGVAHGSLWLPGVGVGLMYGWIVVHTDSLGEAVLAHGVTNALVAATVLIGGGWQLW